MRTTLTIDDDLLARLKATAFHRNQTFKEVVNQTLRRGLDSPDGRSNGKRKIKLITKKLRYRPGIDESRLKEIIDELDIEDGTKA